MKQIPSWVWVVAIVAIASLLLLSTRLPTLEPKATVSYSEFKQMISDGLIKEVTLKGEEANAELKEAKVFGAAGQPTTKITANLPSGGDPDLLKMLSSENVTIWNVPDSGNSWMLSLLPWIIFIGVYIFIMRRMQGNLMDRFGGRNSSDFLVGSAKQEEKAGRKVTFKDVAGQEAAKQEVAELVDFLKHPETYENLGAEAPHGVLLVGPPGTGKTLLARALAGEAGVNFFNISASEFIEMFVGVGASRVRKMFDEAKKRAPSIIFIDELDAVGRVRGTGLGGGNDEREQTLNQILSEMDGFTGHETVIVLAATNRPDVLDPALLRPGRFDRHVTLELPDKSARKAILEVHIRNVPLSGDVDLDTVAASCPGFSGADLKNLVNEAAIAAARDGTSEVSMHHFDEMRDKIIMGTVRTLAIQPDEHHRLAVHEAGHTAVAYFLPHADPLYKVTIIPRGRSLGGTHMLPTEERNTFSEEYLHDRLAVSLAGRCAEKYFLGSVSSGADDDIKTATQLARAMVSRWGMSEEIGPVDLRQSEEHPFLGREMAQPRHFSEVMSSRVDDAVSVLLREAEERGQKIIEDHKKQIEQLIVKLEAEETINRPDIETILGPVAANRGAA
ncbi:MAG: ATP-dependent zinc metalloprotease FtsH [Proteobacteria bacterium]|nr:ATP-dependent zinc metalloprotease FtsH [Pseudomonadota bacterium]